MPQTRLVIRDRKLKELLKHQRKGVKKDFFELLRRAARTIAQLS